MVLRDAGYEVACAGTLAEALALVEQQPPDAAIVGLTLPDGDGVELFRELRSWSRMPIIGLSSHDDEQQTVHALEAGADDCLTEPISPRELLARLDTMFRRVGPSAEESVLRLETLEINFAAHRVLANGREVSLTPTEFKLLRALASHRGRPMSRRALLLGVWGSGFAEDWPLLRAHIANLRHKIDLRVGDGWRYIKTESGIGYRFDD